MVCLLTTQSQVHTQRKITALGDPELFSQRSPEGAEIKKFMSMVDEGVHECGVICADFQKEGSFHVVLLAVCMC